MSVAALGEGRRRSAAARLLEVATPDIYRRSPFRITGLATDTPSRQVRQRRQKAQVHKFGPESVTGDTRLPLPDSPSPDQVRAAFDELDNLEQRLVDELLWWWGAPGKCGCPAEVHELHDRAVRLHATVLDLEESGDVPVRTRSEQWREAANCWFDVLEDERLWDHLRARARLLPDRRLDDSTVEGLRQELPRALLRPQVALAAAAAEPARMVTLLDSWDFHPALLDEERAQAVAPVCDRIESLVEEVNRLRNAGEVAEAADRARDRLVPAAHRLDELAKDTRLRRVPKVRNSAAVTVNNCATALFEEPRHGGGSSVRELLEQALELAVEPGTRESVRNNVAALRTAAPAIYRGAQLRDKITALIREDRWSEAMDELLQMMGDATLPDDDCDWADTTFQSLPQDKLDEVLRARAARKAGRLMRTALWLGHVATAMPAFLSWGVPGWVTALVLALTMALPVMVTDRLFPGGTSGLAVGVAYLCLVASLAYLVGMAVVFGWGALGLCLLGFVVGLLPGSALSAAWTTRRSR